MVLNVIFCASPYIYFHFATSVCTPGRCTALIRMNDATWRRLIWFDCITGEGHYHLPLADPLF